MIQNMLCNALIFKSIYWRVIDDTLFFKCFVRTINGIPVKGKTLVSSYMFICKVIFKTNRYLIHKWYKHTSKSTMQLLRHLNNGVIHKGWIPLNNILAKGETSPMETDLLLQVCPLHLNYRSTCFDNIFRMKIWLSQLFI